MIHHGDCLDVLRTLLDNSVDSLVTDPPAGIGFMGKEWDHHKGGRKVWVAWMESVMRECLRVMKPGAHGLVWALPRTSHWTATALEDAGFEIRDCIYHIAGSGFPKSLNVKKAAEKQGICCTCDVYTAADELPSLPKSTTQKTYKLDAEVLRPSLYVGREVQGPQSEEVPGMRRYVDAKDQGTERSEQDMRTNLSRDVHEQSPQGDTFKAGRDLPAVLEGLLDGEQGVGKSEVLLDQVRRCREGLESKVCCAPEGDCTQGTSGMDCPEPCQLPSGDGRGEQPGVEGRSDLQAQQGQLHRSEIRSVPHGIPADGPQGRLHHGASASHGDSHGTFTDTNGSGSSPRPQHAEQLDRELGVVPGQPGAQDCGSCGKPRVQSGLGTALKPAVECWWLVRKPCSEKTVAANVLKWGTGSINIDGSRITLTGNENLSAVQSRTTIQGGKFGGGIKGTVNENPIQTYKASGRFPSHLLLSHSPHCTETQCDIECAIAMLDAQSGTSKSSGGMTTKRTSNVGEYGYKAHLNANSGGLGDVGGASRFFYCAKVSSSERNVGGPNGHPTVKSLKLMRYLARLVTPPKGVILDPFMGSGSTGLAARSEAFQFIGIERELEYHAIAVKRLEAATGALA